MVFLGLLLIPSPSDNIINDSADGFWLTLCHMSPFIKIMEKFVSGALQQTQRQSYCANINTIRSRDFLFLECINIIIFVTNNKKCVNELDGCFID